MKWWFSPVALIFIIAIGFGLKTWQSSDQQTTLESGTYLPHAKPLIPFILSDMYGEPFTEQSLKGQWSLMFFGYTGCPELCPRTLGIMRQLAQKTLTLNQPLRFILMSIDLEHDTPASLKAYFEKPTYQNLPFLGISGSPDELRKLAEHIGIFIQHHRIPIEGHLEHSGTLILFNPQGQLSAIFNQPSDLQSIERDIRKIIT